MCVPHPTGCAAPWQSNCVKSKLIGSLESCWEMQDDAHTHIVSEYVMYYTGCWDSLAVELKLAQLQLKSCYTISHKRNTPTNRILQMYKLRWRNAVFCIPYVSVAAAATAAPPDGASDTHVRCKMQND